MSESRSDAKGPVRGYFKGKSVIVTGASSGIGYDAALAFGEQGANVTLLARRTAPMEELAAKIMKGGGKALALKCDVLVPAALENVITLANADQIKARVIVEAANGPTTPHADEVLHRKGVYVVPDILANAGGVTVSYFEWVQNQQGYAWTESEVNARLEAIMRRSFAEVATSAQKHRTHLRHGAYTLAVGRVAEATATRGLFP